MSEVRHGGCNCGTVLLETRGAPLRVGLCHCLTCRKESGSTFMAFAVWQSDQVTVTGDTRSWCQASEHRHFCSNCGSGLFGTDDKDVGEIEVRLGCFNEAPTDLTPDSELWTKRREHWSCAVAGAAQHERDRT